MWDRFLSKRSKFGNNKNKYGLYDESILFDDLKITGKSLDGKMKVIFASKNIVTSQMRHEKYEDLLKLTKELLFDAYDFGTRIVINNEIEWADIQEEIMPWDLQTASIDGEDISNGPSGINWNVKREREELRTGFIRQTFVSSYFSTVKGIEKPYTEYNYEIVATYHFLRPGQDRTEKQREECLTSLSTMINGKENYWEDRI
jgi:hypothetical protein